MGRQPFRQMKSDGTMEEAADASGGGKFSTGLINTTKDKLLINDNSWPLHACTVYSAGEDSRQTAYSYDNSHYYTTYWPFIAPRSGDISKISIYVGTVHGSESSVAIGIYDAADGHINDLLGTATFAGGDGEAMASSGTKSQTSFESNVGEGDSQTITLVEGNKYFYAYKRDNTDTTDIDFYVDGSNKGATIMRAVPSNWGSTGYLCFYNNNSNLPVNEAAIGWIQHAGRSRMMCWIEM